MVNIIQKEDLGSDFTNDDSLAAGGIGVDRNELISGDAGNTLAVGADGDLFVPTPPSPTPDVDDVSVADNGDVLRALFEERDYGGRLHTQNNRDFLGRGSGVATRHIFSTNKAAHYPRTFPATADSPQETAAHAGPDSFSVGPSSFAVGSSSIALGGQDLAGSVAEARGYLAVAIANAAQSRTVASGDGSFVLGGANNGASVYEASGPHSVIFGGTTSGANIRARANMAGAFMHFSGDLDVSGLGTTVFHSRGDWDVTAPQQLILGLRATPRVAIGRTSANTALHVEGAVTADNFVTASDERLKENIAPDDGAWVLDLEPVTYNYKVERFAAAGLKMPEKPTRAAVAARMSPEGSEVSEASVDKAFAEELSAYENSMREWDEKQARDKAQSARVRHGFIAQQVRKVAPEIVHEADDGILALDYQETIAGLVAVVKRLEAKVKALEAAAKSSAR